MLCYTVVYRTALPTLCLVAISIIYKHKQGCCDGDVLCTCVSCGVAMQSTLTQYSLTGKFNMIMIIYSKCSNITL